MDSVKRFIEESFPIKEVSIESTKERNIRQGHISTLHGWWARRPLASSRATNYAALISTTEDEWKEKKNFIIKLCKWKNSLDKQLIDKARDDILSSFKGKPPKVLDPFAGGGSIPLEALRLGCETHLSDYNPVAVLIEKCTLELPQKYGKRLAKDVEIWSNWVLNETKKELEQFYPSFRKKISSLIDNKIDNFVPVGFLWTHIIKCQNPSCESDIPLIKQFWLANKTKKKISLFPQIEGKKVKFKIVGSGYENIPNNFNPKIGTISNGKAECLVCGTVIDPKSVKRLFWEKKYICKMTAVVYYNKKEKIKRYKIPDHNDLDNYEKAKIYLREKLENLRITWEIEPLPNEIIHTPNNKEYKPGSVLYNFLPILLYNRTNWGQLFNSRQKLSLITFSEKIRAAYDEMIKKGINKNYVKAITTYLGLIQSRHSSYNSNLCWWEPTGERCFNIFGRQALSMVFDFSEQNPFEILTGNWKKQTKITSNILTHLSILHNYKDVTCEIRKCSATNLNYKDNFFDAVFTDPPYYDNIPYADLSDFYYVLLKRSIGFLHPELFATPLTPKNNEIIAELPLLRGMRKEKAAKVIKGIKTSKFFEERLKKSFKEIYRVLKPNGIAIIVYAHKTTKGWETIINALLDSGLNITASWPISTEMTTRLRAEKSAALASSIYIIARKIMKREVCFYSELKNELNNFLNQKLKKLWDEGIYGADFFIAAIGIGIEVFGKYEKIIDFEDNIIRADKLLVDVREITTNFAVTQILHNGFSEEISPLTRFYVLWRWNYSEAKIPFDEARKLAQSIGISLDQEWNKGFIKKEKQFISILGPKERNLQELEDSLELIDNLHYILLLWEKGENKKEELLNKLSSSYGRSDVFYRVAQAISQTLDEKSKEKQLIDGFLSIKEKLKEKLAPSSKTQEKMDKFFK